MTSCASACSRQGRAAASRALEEGVPPRQHQVPPAGPPSGSAAAGPTIRSLALSSSTTLNLLPGEGTPLRKPTLSSPGQRSLRSLEPVPCACPAGTLIPEGSGRAVLCHPPDSQSHTGTVSPEQIRPLQRTPGSETAGPPTGPSVPSPWLFRECKQVPNRADETRGWQSGGKPR